MLRFAKLCIADWENVGGPVLEKVLSIAKQHARVVCCGMVR
jgi:NADPH-dependent curcumin reductase CurA